MLKEKIKPVKKAKQISDSTNRTLGTVFTIFAAMLLSGTSISGTPLPASAALCGALPPLFSAAALAGGVTGFIIRGSVGENINEIVSMAVILLFRVILAKVFEQTDNVKNRYKFFRVTLIGLIYILTSAVTAALFGLSGALLAAIIFRGILCSAACALFITVIEVARGYFADRDSFNITLETKAAVGAVYVLIIIALSPVSFFGINAARLAADFFIIAAASFGGGGTLIFALSVLGMTLFSPELGRTGVLLAAGALSTGAFHIYGKLAQTAAYTIITLLFCVMLGVPMGSIYIFVEIFIAALAFMLIPDRVTARFFNKINQPYSDMYRIKRFSSAFGRIVEKIDRAASVLNNQALNGKNNSIDFANVFTKVCENCPDFENCVMKNPKHFNRECNIYTEYLKQNGFLTPAELHINGCLYKDIIAKDINKEYNYYKYIQNSGINSGQIEEITIREMDVTRKLFESAGAGIITSPDPQTSLFIKSLLETGAKKAVVNCGFDADKNYHAEILVSSELDGRTSERITRFLSSKISKKFREKPFKERIKWGQTGTKSGSQYGGQLGGQLGGGFADGHFVGKSVDNYSGNSDSLLYKYRYVYSEEYKFELAYGIFDTPAPEDLSEGYSGDSHAVFEDGFGNVAFIISDGMGSGARAAVESAMTVSLITELLEGGADPQNTLRFVNLALEIKSSDETTATADILMLNLYSGKVNLYKMGAARTIAAVSGVTREFSGTSLPAGILCDNEPDSFTFRIAEGDKIALFSDGITEECYPKLREMLLTSGISPDSAAKISAENDRNCSEGSRTDDKTIFFVAVD